MHKPLIEFEDSELDRRIAAALERVPEVQVPEGFAAKVAASVPERALRARATRMKVHRIGDKVAAVSLVVLAVAMMVLAPRMTGSTVYLLIECVLAVQLCSLVLWMETTNSD